MITGLLTAAVGRSCPNQINDVKRIASLLSNVPGAQGGPKEPLSANGAGTGPDLIDAIEKFQQKQFWKKLGRVDVDSATYYRLMALQGSGLVVPQPNSLRVNIAWGAALMAGQDPISDAGLRENLDNRKGWQLLKQIFDETLNGQIPWSDKNKAPFKKDDKTFVWSPREGIQRAGMRVPQAPHLKDGLGIQWCGIFATYIWQKASGLDVKWMMGEGPRVNGKKVKYSTKFEALSPGDIGILKEKDGKRDPVVHHFIVHSMSSDGKAIQTINGNSTSQRILVRPIGIQDIRYFYSVDTLLRLGDSYP